MSKSDANRARDEAKKDRAQTQSDVTNLSNSIGADKSITQSRAAEDYDPAFEGYSKFAATGGYSPEDENSFINASTSGVKGTYDVLSRDADRARAATGGLGGGGDRSRMARYAAQDVADANLKARVALTGIENQNKFSGLGGLTGLYGANLSASDNANAQLLQALGINVQSQGQTQNTYTELAKRPGFWASLGQAAGGIGQGIAGAAAVIP